ncbi:MAG: hypothetical protein U9Q90_00180 [Campylobacterota bacterium]|nr:hypothetical protein [Campylobacterota bacterium]
MKQIVLAFLIIGLMAGCESKEEREQAKQAELFKQEQVQKLKEEELARQRAKEEAERAAKESPTLSKMGVTMSEGKLVIDTNKAKEFFGTLHKRLDNTSKEIDKELKEGNLTVAKSIGIEVTQDKMSIDLNKTKSFLDRWGEQMESFAKEFDKLTKTLHDDENITEPGK